MDNAHQENSVERRRRLLKGALAASGVMTMGYSGAALASFECVAKVRTDFGFPGADLQFRTTPPDPAATQDWAWVKVLVHKYKLDTAGAGGVCTNSGSNNEFDAFKLVETDTTVYRTSAPSVAVTGACRLVNQPTGFPFPGWVLAYFGDDGQLTQTFPNATTATPGQTPATGSCLASVNPGLNTTNITFGG